MFAIMVGAGYKLPDLSPGVECAEQCAGDYSSKYRRARGTAAGQQPLFQIQRYVYCSCVNDCVSECVTRSILGSRYVSWLPNFSVEVTHINNLLRADAVTHTSQIRSLASQVRQMFPRYPMSIIIADLQVTRSLELTVDNILEGRLIIPPHYQEDEEEEEAAVQASSSSPNNSDNNSTLEVREGTSSSDYYVNPARFVQYSDSSSSTTPSSSSPERDSTPTTPSGYEIERNSNIFGNQNELLRESCSDEMPLGDRFSKSSSERERILARRKELLLVQARKRFIDKNHESSAGEVSTLRHRSKTSISD